MNRDMVELPDLPDAQQFAGRPAHRSPVQYHAIKRRSSAGIFSRAPHRAGYRRAAFSVCATFSWSRSHLSGGWTIGVAPRSYALIVSDTELHRDPLTSWPFARCRSIGFTGFCQPRGEPARISLLLHRLHLPALPRTGVPPELSDPARDLASRACGPSSGTNLCGARPPQIQAAVFANGCLP